MAFFLLSVNVSKVSANSQSGLPPQANVQSFSDRAVTNIVLYTGGNVPKETDASDAGNAITAFIKGFIVPGFIGFAAEKSIIPYGIVKKGYPPGRLALTGRMFPMQKTGGCRV